MATNRGENGDRDSLRAPGYWSRVLRAMAAVVSIKLAFRIVLAATIGLVLLFLGWQAG